MKLPINIFTVLVAAVVISVVYFAVNKDEVALEVPVFDIANREEQKVSSPLPSATPFPFSEMTVPFLRSRNYESKLGELVKLSENSNYTSYLTSYTSDGLKINGLLTIPVGNKPAGGFPAVVFVHGYIPPWQYQTTTRYVDHVDFLAKNGFVVFKIDLRGHGNSEGQAGGAYFSEEYVVDVLNARAALASSDFVSLDKIGLWGHSMAGNIVSRAMVAAPDIPAVVIWAGAVYSYVDLVEYGISDNSYQPPPNDSERQRRRRELFAKYGEPTVESEFWKQVAVASYLNDLKGAVQINHVIDDNVVDIAYSRNLNSLLNKTNVVHELNEYSSGGHNITGASFNLAMQDTVDFFKQHLNL